MQLLTPSHFSDYELIDSGGFEKLERFGQFVLVRPEPQAIWNPSMSMAEWDKMSGAAFKLENNDSEKGRWILKKGMPEQWRLAYSYKQMNFSMRLGLTSFRHIGVFPEQAPNWDFIYDQVIAQQVLEITLGDERKMKVIFKSGNGMTEVVETFEAESENSVELQQGGWQAILDNFKKYVETIN